MIHVLDHQTDRILGTLENKPKSALFWDDLHRKLLQNNEEIFDFTMQADVSEAEHFSKRNRVVIPDEDGHFIEFIISETQQFSDKTKEVFTEASYTELAKQKILDPIVLEGQTVNTVTDYILDNTEWQRGITEYAGIRKVAFSEHTNALKALHEISVLFELELRFRVEVKANRITGRFVDLIERTGEVTKKEIEMGKDLIGVTRKENSADIVTAMIGLGPEQEDGTRLIVRVEDEEALQRWGRNGRHLWGIHEPQTEDSDMTEARLRQLTEAQLKKQINTVVEYDVQQASIEHIFGREHEKVRLGDTNRVKDTSYVPALYLDARIISVERSVADKSAKNFVLGDFIEYSEEDIMATFKKLQAALAKKVSESEIQAVREYVLQKAEEVEGAVKEYAEVVALDAENAAKNYADAQDVYVKVYADDAAAAEAEAARLAAEAEARRQAQEAIRQAAIDATNKANAIRDALAGDIADKVDAEWVNGQLVLKADANNVYTKQEADIKLGDKASKTDVYTKTEIENQLKSYVAVGKYEVDQNGVIKRFQDAESRIQQTEEGLLSTVNKTTYQQDKTALQNDINSRAKQADLNNLQIGGRNLVGDFNSKKWAQTSDRVVASSLGICYVLRLEANQDYILHRRNTENNNRFRLFFYNMNTENENDLTGVAADKYSNHDSQLSVTFNSETYKWIVIYVTNQNNVDDISKALIKLEKGNRATDWTPAPEDVDAQLTAVETRMSNAETAIDQTDTKVELRALKTDVYTKTETGTLLNGKADNSRVQSVEQRVTTAEGTITAQAGQINLKANASDVYTKTQTNTELGKKADTGTVTAVTNRVTTAEQNISALDGKIEQRVTKTEFDGLQIGGRNLVGNTSVELVLNTTLTSIPSYPIYNVSDILGEVVTVSFYAKTSNGTDTGYISLALSGSTKQYITDGNFKPTTEYVKYTYTFTVSRNIDINQVMVIFRKTNRPENTGIFYLKKLKLEKGNRTTDWTPAPEDVDGAINGVSTRLSTAEATITNHGTAIEQRVKTTDFTGNTVASLINQTATSVLIQAAKIRLDGYVEAKHIKSLAGLNVNNQFIVDANGNVKFAGNLEGATGTFSGDLSASIIKVKNPNFTTQGSVGLELESGYLGGGGVTYTSDGHFYLNSFNRTLSIGQGGHSNSNGDTAEIRIKNDLVAEKDLYVSGNLRVLGNQVLNEANVKTGTARAVYSATSLLKVTVNHGLGFVPKNIQTTLKWVAGAVSTSWTEKVYVENVTATQFTITVKDDGVHFTSNHFIDVYWMATRY